MMHAGMGFGIDRSVFPNGVDAERGLQYICLDQAAKESTIVTPHLFGPQVTGIFSTGSNYRFRHCDYSHLKLEGQCWEAMLKGHAQEDPLARL